MQNFDVIKSFNGINKQVSLINYNGQKSILKIYDTSEIAENEAKTLSLLSKTGYSPRLIECRDNYLICEYIIGESFLEKFKNLTSIQDEEGLCELAKRMCMFLQIFHSVTNKIVSHIDFENFMLDEKGMCICVSFENSKEGMIYEDIAAVIAYASIHAVGGTAYVYPFIKTVLESFHIDLIDVINDVEDKLVEYNENESLPIRELVEQIMMMEDLTKIVG